MESTAFPYFSWLPAEVRMRIWEAAVRPTSSQLSGIHTFSILNIKNEDRVPERCPALPVIERMTSGLPGHVYGDHPLALVPEYDDNGKPNRSAYFWDAGLWTACWDSRKTMIRRFNVEYWKQKRAYVQSQHAAHAKQLGSSRLPGIPREEYCQLMVDFKVAPLGGSVGDNWRLALRPSQDAFKLGIHPGMYSLSWMHIINQLPFVAAEMGGGPVRNLVLEFDASWHHSWPAHIYCLDMERKPRALVSQILWALIDRRTDCVIWLIDRSYDPFHPQRQHPSRGPARPAVFYDCEEEYVEIVKEYRRYDKASAVSFIYRLAHLGAWRWDSQNAPFSVHDHIRVLKPRRLVHVMQ